jgi:hypothetical protein
VRGTLGKNAILCALRKALMKTPQPDRVKPSFESRQRAFAARQACHE